MRHLGKVEIGEIRSKGSNPFLAANQCPGDGKGNTCNFERVDFAGSSPAQGTKFCACSVKPYVSNWYFQTSRLLNLMTLAA